MKRYFILILTILYCHIAYSIEITPEKRGQFLANNLLNKLNELSIPNDDSLYLQFFISDTKDLNRLLLSRLLLEKDRTLVENENFANYSIMIKANERVIPIKTNSFPRRTNLYKETVFTTQFTEMSAYEIIKIHEFSHQQRLIEEKKTQNRWYDPFLISFVLGSLVYLIYLW